MASKKTVDLREEFTKTREGAIQDEFQYLCAAFEGRVPETWIDSITIKRRFDGNFLGVLKGVRDRGKPSAVSLVAFTTAGSLPELFGLVEFALGTDSLKWTLDRYAEDSNSKSADDTDSPIKFVNLKK